MDCRFERHGVNHLDDISGGHGHELNASDKPTQHNGEHGLGQQIWLSRPLCF